MYINGIVIGVFCTLFVEMSICIGGWLVCKVTKCNSKTNATVNSNAKKATTGAGGKYDRKDV